MLGSNFFEQLVQKENTGAKAKMTILLGSLLTLVLIIGSFVLGFFLLLLAMAAGFLTWYLATNCEIEYEYVMAEEELTITKIIAQRKRKEMISTTLLKFTAFGKLSEAPSLPDSTTLVIACAAENENTYFAEFPHESYGNVRLLMTPDEQFLSYFAKKLPRNLNFRYTPSVSQDIDESAR